MWLKAHRRNTEITDEMLQEALSENIQQQAEMIQKEKEIAACDESIGKKLKLTKGDTISDNDFCARLHIFYQALKNLEGKKHGIHEYLTIARYLFAVDSKYDLHDPFVQI